MREEATTVWHVVVGDDGSRGNEGGSQRARGGGIVAAGRREIKSERNKPTIRAHIIFQSIPCGSPPLAQATLCRPTMKGLAQRGRPAEPGARPSFLRARGCREKIGRARGHSAGIIYAMPESRDFSLALSKLKSQVREARRI